MSTSTSAPSSTHRAPSFDANGTIEPTTKKRRLTSKPGQTMLLHVNLPTPLVMAVRAMAVEDHRRTITSMVEILLEESPDMVEWQRNAQLPRVIQG